MIYTHAQHSISKGGVYYASVAPPDKQIEIVAALNAASAMLAALELIRAFNEADCPTVDFEVLAKEAVSTAIAAAKSAGITS